jgi:hypothetical protein
MATESGNSEPKPTDIILIIVRTWGRVDRKSIHDIFHIVYETLKLNIPDIKFVKEFRRPHCPHIEHLIDLLRDFRFLKEEMEHEDEGNVFYYTLTIDGEIVYRHIIEQNKLYRQVEKLVEVLPPSKKILRRLSQAVYIREHDFSLEGWNLTETDVRQALGTLAGLLTLGGVVEKNE